MEKSGVCAISIFAIKKLYVGGIPIKYKAVSVFEHDCWESDWCWRVSGSSYVVTQNELMTICDICFGIVAVCSSFFLGWPLCNSKNCFLLITFYCHLLFHQVISLLPLDSFLSLLHQLLADTERDMQKKSIAILSARLENPRTKFTSQHVSPIAALCGDVACWWVHYGHVLLYIQFSVTDLYRDVIQLVYS